MRRSGAVTYLIVGAVCVLGSLALPALAEGLPTFQYAYGQPAIRPLWPDVWAWTGYEESVTAPPVAVTAGQILVGGRAISVFSPEGKWATSWPFSSEARGLGQAADQYTCSQANDLATSPAGDVYAADAGFGSIHRYSSAGAFIGGWAVPAPAGQTAKPVAVAAPAGAVWVLDAGLSRIVVFTPDGALVTERPVTLGGAGQSDLAAASDGSAWLLTQSEDGTQSRVTHYSAGGAPLATWTLPVSSAIETDAGGALWAAQPGAMRHYSASGALLKTLSVPEGITRFAISPEAKLYLLAQEVVPQYYYSPIVYRVETRDFEGNLLAQFGGQGQFAAEGVIVDGRGLAVTPEGESYVRGAPGTYVTHYDADGNLLETIQTDQWPVYNRWTGSVEFVTVIGDQGNAHGPSGVTPEGVAYDYGVSAGMGDSFFLSVMKVACEEDEWGATLDTFDIPGPPAEGVTGDYVVTWAVAEGPDGLLYGCMATEPFGLWVVAYDVTQRQVVRSWTTQDLPGYFIHAMAVDAGGNVYIHGTGLWKYTADGVREGPIDEWCDEPGAAWLTRDLFPGALKIDAAGRIRALDYMANQVFVFASDTSASGAGPFPDTAADYWAADEIAAAVEAGLVEGYPDGRYHPDDVVTRGQMAVFISRGLAGGDDLVPDPTGGASFTDVPESDWAWKYVEYAKSHDIVTGYWDGSYRPNAPVDRGQMAAFIARATAGGEAAVPQATGDPAFTDVGADYWAYQHIQYLQQAGIVGGYGDGSYHPGEPVTRAQMAVFVARAFGLGG